MPTSRTVTSDQLGQLDQLARRLEVLRLGIQGLNSAEALPLAELALDDPGPGGAAVVKHSILAALILGPLSPHATMLRCTCGLTVTVPKGAAVRGVLAEHRRTFNLVDRPGGPTRGVPGAASVSPSSRHTRSTRSGR
jgi:hypothetical protein